MPAESSTGITSPCWIRSKKASLPREERASKSSIWKVDPTLAEQFPPAPAKEMVLSRCSTSYSLKMLLNQRRTDHEWEIATFGMLGGRDQDGETIVKYLTAHFGK